MRRSPSGLRRIFFSFSVSQSKNAGHLSVVCVFGTAEGMHPLRACRPCSIAASDFEAKNSPPDCFLNASHPLRVRIPSACRRCKNTATRMGDGVFGTAEGMHPLRACRPCSIAASDFEAKNSPPDCFLNASHPLRVRIPSACRRCKNTATRMGDGVFGTAEGIRTPDLLVRSQTLYPAELQPHTALDS